MQKEVEPITLEASQRRLENLSEQKQRAETVAEQRANLYEVIGTGRIKEIEDPVRVGLLKDRVENSMLRSMQHSDQIDAQIKQETSVQRAI